VPEPGWLGATGLKDYHRIGLNSVQYDEGAADLEYTYTGEQDTAMHGENRMLRMNGRLFLLCWLTTGFTWTADLALMNYLQPSFGLDA
jgi:hypothetical protein